jgi:hypothetical protein
MGMGDFWVSRRRRMQLPGPSLPMAGIAFYRLLAVSPRCWAVHCGCDQ